MLWSYVEPSYAERHALVVWEGRFNLPYSILDDNPFTNEFMAEMGCAVPDDILYINDSLSTELIY